MYQRVFMRRKMFHVEQFELTEAVKCSTWNILSSEGQIALFHVERFGSQFPWRANQKIAAFDPGIKSA